MAEVMLTPTFLPWAAEYLFNHAVYWDEEVMGGAQIEGVVIN